MWFSKRHVYSKVAREDKGWSFFSASKARGATGTIAPFVGCFFAGALVMFFIIKAPPLNHPSTKFELDLEPHTFRYNRSFSYPPSNHTNRAWRNIFPEKGGFFVHPTIAPTRSTFSVFHQLHCLNGLRGGYWANHEAAVTGHQVTDQDLPVDIQPSHMRHCIDYLRQVLMCHGDMTLEVVDETINGVHGFRTEHQCINWEHLNQWTSEQQAKQHVEQIV